jgi:hypothetical protein
MRPPGNSILFTLPLNTTSIGKPQNVSVKGVSSTSVGRPRAAAAAVDGATPTGSRAAGRSLQAVKAAASTVARASREGHIRTSRVRRFPRMASEARQRTLRCPFGGPAGGLPRCKPVRGPSRVAKSAGRRTTLPSRVPAARQRPVAGETISNRGGKMSSRVFNIETHRLPRTVKQRTEEPVRRDARDVGFFDWSEAVVK